MPRKSKEIRQWMNICEIQGLARKSNPLVLGFGVNRVVIFCFLLESISPVRVASGCRDNPKVGNSKCNAELSLCDHFQ